MTNTERESLLNGEWMPFGKFEGKPLSMIIKDKGYCSWLCKQSWLKDWPYLYGVMLEFYGEEFKESKKREPIIFEGIQKLK